MAKRQARYGRKAQQKVKRAMHEPKRGTLRTGPAPAAGGPLERGGGPAAARGGGGGGGEGGLVPAPCAVFAGAAGRGGGSFFSPAVSAGIFAVPLEICARAYVRAGRASPLRKVRLCLRDQPVIDAVLRELAQ